MSAPVPASQTIAPASPPTRAELRTHAATALLLGVDFLPVSQGAPPTIEPGPPRSAPTSHAPDAPTLTPTSDNERARRQALLDELRARHDARCPHCTRAKGHTRTVFGEGDPCATLMFIGEAPGAEEDRTGRPFVGRAGQKLDEMIRAMGLTRESVYIANILKARPPENATPTPDEAARCGPYLREQVRIISPRVIVALGRPASQYLLDTTDSMGALRGRWAKFQDGERAFPVMPTFHPAFLLRQYTPENRKKVWSDLQQAMARLSAGD